MTDELATMLNRALAKYGVVPLFGVGRSPAPFFDGIAFLTWVANDGLQTIEEQAAIVAQLNETYDAAYRAREGDVDTSRWAQLDLSEMTEAA